MTFRRFIPVLLMIAVTCGGLMLLPDEATGDAREEMDAAVERGKELWVKKFGDRGKTCKTCHEGGRNKLTADRMNDWPKYDKALKKVVTGQQKINQMIEKHGKGTALELGSDDLNALEAYIKTR